MRKVGNEYHCDKDEWIQINFKSNPNRANVNIDRSLDGEPLVILNQNHYRFKMTKDVRNLTLLFSFLGNGNCEIDIGGIDDDDASSLTGVPEQKDYIFKVV